MKQRNAGRHGMVRVVGLTALGLSMLGYAAAQDAPAPKNFTVQSQHGVSIPLRDMPNVYITGAPERFEHEPFRGPALRGARVDGGPARPDEVRQDTPAISAATPTLGLNFEGLGVDQGGLGGDPPDSDGAIGATQYVEWINSAYAVYNKTTGVKVAGPTSGTTLFAGLGGANACATNNNGDPMALWDRVAQRWVISQFAIPQFTKGSGGFHQCVAVSQTADATGAYNLYDFTYADFNDYPKMGVWSDKYLQTFNFFNATGTAFVGGTVCAYDRTAMLAGNPANQACVTFPTEFGFLPSDVDGPTAPSANSHGYFAELFSFSSLGLLTVNSVDFSTGTLNLTGPVEITVPTFTEACNGGNCVPQSGTTQKLASLGDRLMFRLAYRNFGSYESMVVNHSVDVTGTGTGQTGVRWYELHQNSPGGVLSGSFTTFQSGSFAPADSGYRWMGSVAMDSYRNIAAGYSLSNTTGTPILPSIYLATRAPGDAAGALGNETLTFTGTGFQPTTGSSQPYRWGDYTAMTMDPADDCTMWYINQYLTTSAQFNWNTRIQSFKIAGCGDTPVSATMATPAPGSTLAGTSQTFDFNSGLGVQDYDLWVGTTSGAHDIANIDTFGALSADVSGLPATGQGVYVTLWSKINGTWSQSNKYLYTASGVSVPSAMTSPAGGSTLGASTLFTWTAGTGVSQHSLYVGTTPGAHDIAFVNAGAGTSTTVAIPQNGGTVYVTLYSLIAGTYHTNSYTYVAGGAPAKATMISPAPGSMISGGSTTFTWTAGSGVTQYSLYVGTSQGSTNIAYVNAHQATSAPVSGIPTNGSTVFVTLYSLIGGSYQGVTYTYTTGP